MTLRGVNTPGSLLSTSRLLGMIRDDPRTRGEFLRAVGGLLGAAFAIGPFHRSRPRSAGGTGSRRLCRKIGVSHRGLRHRLFGRHDRGRDCVMPNSLKFDADQQFLEAALDNVDLLVHGRKSHEGQPNSAARRRLLMTRCIPRSNAIRICRTPGYGIRPGSSLEGACGLFGLSEGVIGVIGGTAAYDLFLDRYAYFHLCRAGKVGCQAARRSFRGSDSAVRPRSCCESTAWRPGRPPTLDPVHDVTHVRWTPVEK